jgi:hypothetical protein
MTETTHTPLPWTFEAGVEDNEGEFYVCHAGTVCTETTVCNPRNEADARLIVQAVNSHHRLVEALREARRIIADIDDYMKRPSRGDWGEECACCMGELLDDDRNAIAKIDAALKEAGRG